jgi:hypothetical protein
LSTTVPIRPTHRLYVDEIGHASLKTGASDNDRYLGLIGVACELRYVQEHLGPEMENLKRYFVRSEPAWRDPDDSPRPPLIFHRNELVGGRYPFEALRDPQLRSAFDEELLMRLEEWAYTVFYVTIDKTELAKQYEAPAHPYHYGLETLLERYVHWLMARGTVGDVMAEARGGREDRLLKDHFQSLYKYGGAHADEKVMAGALTSGELKLRLKKENVAGLQLAEFLISGCHATAIAEQKGLARRNDFNARIEAIVRNSKYCRHNTGRIEGYGCIWLP